MTWTVIGSAAACLTMFAFIPQIIKAIKTKSVKDVSIITLCELALGVSLWVVYGVHLKDPAIVIANTVTLVTVIILLFLYFNYGKTGK